MSNSPPRGSSLSISLPLASIIEHVGKITTVIDRALSTGNQAEILGAEVMALLATRTGQRVPPEAVVRLALLADCLRVIDSALLADGKISPGELEHIFEVVYPIAGFFSRLRDSYRPYQRLYPENQAEFLAHYRNDPGPFGRACEATEWLGLEICGRVLETTRDPGALDLYERMVVHLMDSVLAIDGTSTAAREIRDALHVRIEHKRRAARSAAAVASEEPRVRAFCDPNGIEVFSGVAHATQIWHRDPTDVESIHGEARAAFERVIDRVVDHGHGHGDAQRGRILLVLGESGSGKTHLVRAFRNYLHGRRLGYAGYMQMSTRAPDYARYVLANLVDSLEHPYDPPAVDSSGLLGLSNAVTEACDGISAEDRERLREAAFDGEDGQAGELDDFVSSLADRILATPGYGDFDPDILRAVLYLQRRDPPTQARVHKYLRGEELRDRDRRLLGDMPNRRDDPVRVITALGRLMWTAQRAALVVAIDQLEEIYDVDDTTARVERFRSIMNTVRQIADQVPSAVVVVACLEHFYAALKPHLTRSVLDRIERDPDPIHLTSRRSFDEITALVRARLRYFYDAAGVRQPDDDGLFPFRPRELGRLTNLRTRDVLDWCRRYQESCVVAGELVDVPPVLAGDDDMAEPGAEHGTGTDGGEIAASEIARMEQAFNDACTASTVELPQSDSAFLHVLAWAVDACASELGPDWIVRTRPDGDFLELEVGRGASPRAPAAVSLLAMCNRAPQGRGLSNQISSLRERARQRRPVAIRCSEFPQNPKTRIAGELGQLIAAGGRRIVVEASAWRTMVAFREFAAQHEGEPAFAAWRRDIRPLAQLDALRALLDDEEAPLRRQRIIPAAPSTSTSPSPSPPGTAGASSTTATPGTPGTSGRGQTRATSAGARPAARPDTRQAAAHDPRLCVGKTAALNSEPVHVALDELVRHAGFLGSTGSGKTTLALRVIEELLGRGIAAVLVDRKGDLAGYADRAAWPDNPALAHLARNLDIRVYTPGDPGGRPLAIPLVPAGMADMPSHERNQVAGYAAAALGAMLRYKDSSSTDRAYTGILAKAIELVGELDAPGGKNVAGDRSLARLIELVAREDPALLNAIGRLDTRHFAKLVDHLETLRITRGELLTGGGNALDIAELLGRGAANGEAPGRDPAGRAARPGARLSIISTKFLGDNAAIEFWIARLLVELTRWASRNPSPALQAVLFLDEADMYLPAQGKPATKEPMLDLLKRARSAGIGVLLATQSPGDLDYKARDNVGTWFIGRIAEKRAIGKMQPLFSESRVNVARRVASHGVGEFAMLRGGDTVFFKADRSALDPRQLSDAAILELARAPRG